ncbi:reverse transcriptase domain-containing protein [Tanacetum coccineum]
MDDVLPSARDVKKWVTWRRIVELGFMVQKRKSKGWNKNLGLWTLKGDDIEAYSNRNRKETSLLQSLRPLHEAINMARELVEQSVQAPAGGKIQCWKFTKMQPRATCTYIRTVSSKSARDVKEIGQWRTDCRVRLQGACNNFLQNVTCFECGEKGHFKDKCSKAGNQQNDGARGRAYVVIEKSTSSNSNCGHWVVFDVIIGLDWLAYTELSSIVMRKIVPVFLFDARFLIFRREARKRIFVHWHVSRLMRKSLRLKCCPKDFPEFIGTSWLNMTVSRGSLAVESVKNWNTPESQQKSVHFLGLAE